MEAKMLRMRLQNVEPKNNEQHHSQNPCVLYLLSQIEVWHVSVINYDTPTPSPPSCRV